MSSNNLQSFNLVGDVMREMEKTELLTNRWADGRHPPYFIKSSRRDDLNIEYYISGLPKVIRYKNCPRILCQTHNKDTQPSRTSLVGLLGAFESMLQRHWKQLLADRAKSCFQWRLNLAESRWNRYGISFIDMTGYMGKKLPSKHNGCSKIPFDAN